MTDPRVIVQKLWNYCNILRDDGLSYGDYVEQLTFLLFLKMADERVKRYKEKSVVPKVYSWQSLMKLDGDALDQHYRRTLESLGYEKDERLRIIFSRAQNKIQDPAKLKRLIVDLIDHEEWLALDTDVKGDAYEGLLQKNAEDTKGGAGQYFTPRPLIDAIVEVTRPRPHELICDPACGTGGFLLSTHKFVTDPKHYKLSSQQRKKFDNENLHGVELVDSVARICLMNMVLHGIGGGKSVNIERKDSLREKPLKHFDVVLTNPPFGKKSTVTLVNKKSRRTNDSLEVERDDFWRSSSNKQLNFIQHIFNLLRENGRSAVIIPDNVLFEGGVGETVRKNLLEKCDVHTLLRLPTGIFYAQGVKANVLFFDRKPLNSKGTKELYIYDLRTNLNFTLRTRPLKSTDFREFIQCYNPKNRKKRKPTYSEENPQGRWRAYQYDELVARDKTNLDIFWLRDESVNDNLEEPDVIAMRIVTDLQSAVKNFGLIVRDLTAT